MRHEQRGVIPSNPVEKSGDSQQEIFPSFGETRYIDNTLPPLPDSETTTPENKPAGVKPSATMQMPKDK